VWISILLSSRLYTCLSISEPCSCTTVHLCSCPALCTRALACKYVSRELVGPHHTTVLAAVRVTPCAAAAGWIINTCGSTSFWKALKISVRCGADTLPCMMALLIPSLFNLPAKMFIACRNGTNIRTFWLDSSITSRRTLYLCFTSNSSASPLSVYIGVTYSY
jgi:hypothetical protein